jgi:beta-lactamase class D
LTSCPKGRTILLQWGRTGFDLVSTPEAACRGWFVGLVNHRTEKLIANEELALAA